jgi:putative membrane protein
MSILFGFGALIAFLFFIVFLVGVIWLIIWSVRRSRNGVHETSIAQSHQSPEEILKIRYARGEIDREEYLRRKKDLE